MANNILQYDLLLSCPGDITKDETDEVNGAIEEFNEMYSDTLNLSLRLRHWGISSFSQSGGKPQDLLNKQFVHDCDAAIALFWTRFGTPTDEYQSGTEEEIEYMLDSQKQVFMYFSDKLVPPSSLNNDEYNKVIEFRKQYATKGIYGSYSSKNELRKLVFAHLSKYFLTKARIAEIEVDMKPNLSVVGIGEDDSIDDTAKLRPFEPIQNRFPNGFQLELLDKFKIISDMKINVSRASNNQRATFNKSIKVDETIIEFLTEFSGILGIILEEEFFYVGNIEEDKLTSSLVMLGRGRSLIGSDSEIIKYNLINELYWSSKDYLYWLDFTEIYSKLKCVKLAVLNNGKSYDEDIEITLSINKEAFISLEELPEIEEYIKRYLLDKYEISNIFGISETLEVRDYESSIRTKQIGVNSPVFRGVYESIDYDELFKESIREAFCYSIYETEKHFVVKLNIEYLKHNSTVAFPTVLFLYDELSVIEYEITSKYYPEKINGSIKIEVKDK